MLSAKNTAYGLYLILGLFMYTQNVHAVVRYVKTGNTGTAPYTSWATASNDLQAVINACNSGDQIWVAAGTYFPTTIAGTGIGLTNRDKAIVMKTGVSIYGGFTGTEILLGQRNYTTNISTLSGDIGTVGTATDNCYHVVISAAASGGGRLDGLTISNGYADNSISNNTVNGQTVRRNRAGGIYIILADPEIYNCVIKRNTALDGAGAGAVFSSSTASPVFNNCTFSQNSTSSPSLPGNCYGGGIFIGSSSPEITTLTNCTFTSNTADAEGGGVYIATGGNASISTCIFTSNSALKGGGLGIFTSTSISITDCQFTSNSATQTGGGIYDSITSPEITNCVFTGNSANYGGGIGNYSSSPDITNCSFINNTTLTSGGGIRNNDNSLPTINKCNFTGNSAIFGGGIDNRDLSSAVINSCVLAGNTATYGGGINSSYGSSPQITNCGITGNSASSGGGISNYTIDAVSVIINCTISGNKATSTGGGIYTITGGTTQIKNSIIWGNITGVSANSISGTATVSYSDVEGGFSGIGNINTDPLFLNPQTASSAPTTAGDYHVKPCSPVLDAGNNALIPSGITTDIEGYNRIINTTVDMGAYEKQYALPDVTGIVYVDKTKNGDGKTWATAVPELADALKAAKSNSSITEIWVAKGTYYPLYDAATLGCSPTDNRDKAFVMVNNVKVYGGFAGGEATINQRDFISNETILSGDIGASNNTTDNCYHVVIGAGTVNSLGTSLDGFTISGGNANAYTASINVNGFSIDKNKGGGIYIESSSPMIKNCTVSNNHAEEYGGGMLTDHSSSPVILNCKVIGNTLYSGPADASYRGGCGMAILNSSSPVITNCILTGNNSNSDGGGIAALSSSAPVITNCTIAANKAKYTGGGISVISCPAIGIKNSVIWGNGSFGISSFAVIPVSNCIVQGGYSGTNVFNVDPQFINPQPASSAPTIQGDYRLQACSPAINIGNNADIPSGITTDLDNNPRIAYTDVDLGAYEQQTNAYMNGNFTTWKGVNTNWHDKVNWCGGFIPTSTVDVTIPSSLSNYPLLSSAGSTKNIILNNGSSISVAAAAQLTINGTYTNNGSTISNNGTLVFTGNAASQSFPGTSGTVTAMNNLEINNSNGITFNRSFSITGSLIPTAGNINLNNDTITLRSTAAGTASVAAVQPGASISYTGTGKFEIQRFINTGTGTGEHGKSWQFLATPASGETVFQSWQEKGLSPAGFGTWITGTGSGFDATTVLPSIKYYDVATGNYKAVTNTATPLLNKSGYMIFVRGDRNVISFNGAANNTTLRSRGQIYSPSTPPPLVTVPANSFQSFGNPYPSRIEFSKVRAISTGINDVFYVWDPTLAGTYNVGGWQTISGIAGYVPTVGVPPTGNPASPYYPAGVPAPYIESGQAVFVKGNATGGNINFNENCKTPGNRLVNRGMPQNIQEDKQLLFSSLFTSSGIIADGNIVVFGRRLSNTIDDYDALKMINDGENFGIARNGYLLSVESRNFIAENDTIFFNIKNLRKQAYQLRFAPKNVSSSLSAYLVDNYLHSRQEISLRDSSFVDFIINAEPGSAAINRFMIVFSRKKFRLPSSAETVFKSDNNGCVQNTETENPAISIYPNPISGRTVNMKFIGMPEGYYVCTVSDNSGKKIHAYTLKHTVGSGNESIVLPAGIAQGNYIITIKGPGGYESTAKIIFRQ